MAEAEEGRGGRQRERTRKEERGGRERGRRRTEGKTEGERGESVGRVGDGGGG